MARGAEAARKFRAGKENKFREERMSEDRRAWLKTFVGQFVLKISPRDEEDPSEYGDSVWLVIPRPNSRPIMLNLTALTGEEVGLMQEFFNTVFELAKPLCVERDAVAASAYERGDDSHIRLYRAKPELVVRGRVREELVVPEAEALQHLLREEVEARESRKAQRAGTQEQPEGEGE